jgi:hypothetical protein
MIRFYTLPLALAASASGALADPAPAIRLPDTSELASFAEANWSDWGARLARFAGRTDEATELVRLENSECTYLSGQWPDCKVTITARFADGALVTRTLFATFERNEQGQLEEVIVMLHPRSEPLVETRQVDVPPVN